MRRSSSHGKPPLPVRFGSPEGDVFDVLKVEAASDLHQLMGAYDVGVGSHEKPAGGGTQPGHVRRLDFRVAGPIVISAPIAAGAVTSVQNVLNTFTDNTKAFVANQFARVHNVSYLVHMLTGTLAGQYRYITSNTATRIVTGVDFTLGAPGLQVGDTYEIVSATLRNAEQAALDLGIQTDGEGIPVRNAARFGELIWNTGFQLMFGRLAASTAGRNLLRVLPLVAAGNVGVNAPGDPFNGQYDVELLPDSSSMLRRLQLPGMGLRGRAITFASPAGDRTITAFDVVLVCDTTGGAFQVTLPDAATAAALNSQAFYIVKRSDASANNLTVATGGGNIDGAATDVLGARAVGRYYAFNGAWHKL